MRTFLGRASDWLTDRRSDGLGLKPAYVLIALFLLGYVLRIIGVDWGMRHGDERVNHAAKVLAGEFFPEQFYYPPLNNYLTAVVYAGMFVVGRLAGIFHSLQDFKAAYFENLDAFYFAARFHTAFWGALTAPLGALIARRFDISWRGAYLVGLLLALLPPSVWWSHVAKPQMGMVTGCLLLGLAILVFLDHLESRWAAVGVGAAAALATAFKQNAIFLAVPLLAATAVLAYRRNRDLRATAISGGIAVAAGAVAFFILAIGVFLDLQNFLDHQLIQTQMSNRELTLQAFFTASVGMVMSFTGGATPLLFLGFLALPFIDRDDRIIAFWVCTLLGFLWVASMVGDRTIPGLYLHFVSYFVVLSAVVALRVLDRGHPEPMRWGGLVFLAAGLLSCVAGSGLVIGQALRPPSHREVQAFFKEKVSRDAWILASEPTLAGLDESLDARKFMRAREERLAAKYGLTLAPPAEGWTRLKPNPFKSWNVIRFPWPPFGMEHLKEEDVKVVVAHSWPRQEEEWVLEYWAERGFRYVIVRDEQHHIDNWPDPFSSFHKQVRAECALEKVIPARRPLFFETELKIYDCAPSRAQTDSPSPSSSDAEPRVRAMS